MSDTHGVCDKKMEKYLADCDEIWHAGDIGSLEVVNKLRSFAPLRAVYGNIDDQNIRHEFSEFLSFDCEGVSQLLRLQVLEQSPGTAMGHTRTALLHPHRRRP